MIEGFLVQANFGCKLLPQICDTFYFDNKIGILKAATIMLHIIYMYNTIVVYNFKCSNTCPASFNTLATPLGGLTMSNIKLCVSHHGDSPFEFLASNFSFLIIDYSLTVSTCTLCDLNLHCHSLVPRPLLWLR